MISRKTGYLRPLEGASAGAVPAAALQLEALGYALLPGVLDQAQIDQLVEDVDAVYRNYPPDARGAAVRSAEVDEEFRYEMFNRSASCQTLASHPALLQVLEPLLGEDCHVIANTCWRNSPVTSFEGDSVTHGGGLWHIDAGPHVPRSAEALWPEDWPYPVFAVGVHVYLQDCPIECGPTGVIAGSHRSGQPPPKDRADDVSLTWGEEGVTPLLARAGDAAMFVSDVWHRRLPSQPGDRGRFFVQLHYGRRDIAQRVRTSAQVNQLSAEALARIGSEREAQLLGVHTPRFYDG